jgi:hypothetical protein
MKNFIILHTTVYVLTYADYRIGQDSKAKVFLLHSTQWRTEGGGGVWGFQTPPPKFRSFTNSNRIAN